MRRGRQERAQLALQQVAGRAGAGGGVRALVALDDDPAVVAGVEQRPGDRREVDEPAVGAGLGEPARAPRAPRRARGPSSARAAGGTPRRSSTARASLSCTCHDAVARSRWITSTGSIPADGQLAGVEGEPDERGVGPVEQRVERVVAAQRGQEVDVQRGAGRRAPRWPGRPRPSRRRAGRWRRRRAGRRRRRPAPGARAAPSRRARPAPRRTRAARSTIAGWSSADSGDSGPVRCSIERSAGSQYQLLTASTAQLAEELAEAGHASRSWRPAAAGCPAAPSDRCRRSARRPRSRRSRSSSAPARAARGGRSRRTAASTG